MDPLQATAQFAAWVWFSNHADGTWESEREATRFTRENWIEFLPLADEGLGALLLKIAEPRLTARNDSARNMATDAALLPNDGWMACEGSKEHPCRSFRPGHAVHWGTTRGGSGLRNTPRSTSRREGHAQRGERNRSTRN